jgi:DNA-binding beta-propeller fold protein YncE
VAVDKADDVYVIEWHNCRVQVFDSEGNFIMKWGNQGSGDGQFKAPSSIAVDGSGDVYVADTGNNRIQVFNSKGRFLLKWGTQGSDDGQFDYPVDIAVDSSERVYVVDSWNNRIQVFDSKGNFLTKWGTYGAGEMGLAWPRGIAVSRSGEVYVADTYNHRIKVYRPFGGGAIGPGHKQLGKWGEVKQTALFQNFPNPFNPETWIPYQLGDDAHVKFSIYDSTGKLVQLMDLGHKPAGSYMDKDKAIYWDGRNEAGEPVSSGTYFIHLSADSFSSTRKIVMIR